jgi:hypothetical protein
MRFGCAETLLQQAPGVADLGVGRFLLSFTPSKETDYETN